MSKDSRRMSQSFSFRLPAEYGQFLEELSEGRAENRTALIQAIILNQLSKYKEFSKEQQTSGAKNLIKRTKQRIEELKSA